MPVPIPDHSPVIRSTSERQLAGFFADHVRAASIDPARQKMMAGFALTILQNCYGAQPPTNLELYRHPVGTNTPAQTARFALRQLVLGHTGLSDEGLDTVGVDRRRIVTGTLATVGLPIQQQTDWRILAAVMGDRRSYIVAETERSQRAGHSINDKPLFTAPFTPVSLQGILIPVETTTQTQGGGLAGIDDVFSSIDVARRSRLGAE